MARQLFGTDGIRGAAGTYPLDAQTVFAFGRALGEWAAAHEPGAKVLIGMDTRESGPALAGLVTAGLERQGVPYEFAGVIPTPGVAWLTRTGPYAAGLMISASHNPYQDNGLKVFAHSGYKLPDADELAMEGRILALREDNFDTPRASLPASAAAGEYLRFLAASFDGRLEGRKIVIDGGNGAASAYAGRLLEGLGAAVVALHCAPTGRNINLHCGALHTEDLAAAVAAHGADLGVAFDGDADRAMFRCASGRAIDGDHVMLLCAADAAARGELPKGEVVATVMSNLGLELALRQRGLRLIRTAVGDKYVLEEMIRIGAPIGGEQSGHLIFHRHATTGDGMLTLLRVLEVMGRRRASLEELASEMVSLPQKLVNVRFGRKRPLEELDAVQAAIRNCEREFGEAGRVLVRFSGTEPLARVMVEGTTGERVDFHAHSIANAIEAALAA